MLMKQVIYLIRPKIFQRVSLALVLGSALLAPVEGKASTNSPNLSMEELFQSQIVVKGKVSSQSDGMGLPGVTVLEKGTTNGTVADVDGQFSITVSSSSSVLVFSYIGFNTVEVAVNNQTSLNVVMSENEQAMDEVVVTALGIEREKRSLGYAVGEVDGDAMRTVAQENLINALAGRVAGVQINQTSG